MTVSVNGPIAMMTRRSRPTLITCIATTVVEQERAGRISSSTYAPQNRGDATTTHASQRRNTTRIRPPAPLGMASLDEAREVGDTTATTSATITTKRLKTSSSQIATILLIPPAHDEATIDVLPPLHSAVLPLQLRLSHQLPLPHLVVNMPPIPALRWEVAAQEGRVEHQEAPLLCPSRFPWLLKRRPGGGARC